ncbi:MAG: molybdopterin-binding protein [Anaerolineales bacterium]
MPEFLELLPPPEALNLFLNHLSPEVKAEEISTADGLDRLIYSPVVAPHPLPSFPRSTVDGYALRSVDTHGASDSLPAYLSVVGEVPMGEAVEISIKPTECVLIHTGGMLPQGADAVVMVENTQSVRMGEVEILRPVAMAENVLEVGEDVKSGEQVLDAGFRLRPAEIGGLMALGITRIIVARQPKVGIISSGDEVIPPKRTIGPGQVRDVNSYTLSALVAARGGTPVRYGIVGDKKDVMLRLAGRAKAECDLVVITAGSSASTRDLTAQVIDELGSPGVLVHGVNVRPGKPTILAVCDGKAMIGLPGNPVSALVIASLFVSPVLDALQGLKQTLPRATIHAQLTTNLASKAGREDWIPVRLLTSAEGYQAEPIFGKSNLIFTLSKADGLIRITADANGISSGEMVEVNLF